MPILEYGSLSIQDPTPSVLCFLKTVKTCTPRGCLPRPLCDEPGWIQGHCGRDIHVQFSAGLEEPHLSLVEYYDRCCGHGFVCVSVRGLQCTAPMLLLVSTLEVWTVGMGTNLGSTLENQLISCSWEAALVVSLSPVAQAIA
jgi:hypothetical protein